MNTTKHAAEIVFISKQMKKDIDFPIVTGISIAIVKRDFPEETQWVVYLLNQNDFDLENVLVCSKGYGLVEGEKRQSSTLRHGFPHIAANSFIPIEPISPEVFQLTNEYWLSYYVGQKLFDKKFIFVPDSIIDDNLVNLPLLNETGILHV